MEPNKLAIVYEDEFLVAVNKPPGLLVHKTRLSEDTTSALQILRDQLGQWVYTVHRIDRGTSGLLFFGKSSEAAVALAAEWQERRVKKRYIAVVRGYIEETGIIDYALEDQETGTSRQSAVTHFKRLAVTELPLAIGKKYTTARYSLVEAEPITGRRQQLRKHFAHIFHPILGDKRQGDNKHNMYWQKNMNLERMLLHAIGLSFIHPFSKQPIELEAPLDEAFKRALEQLDFLHLNFSE